MTGDQSARWTVFQVRAFLQGHADSQNPQLHWSTDTVLPNAVAVTTNPVPELTMTVTREGLVHLQGQEVRADIVPRLWQEALILFHLLNGRVVLHGSAVAIGGVAAVIVGPSGAGKSTTANALLACGASLLSDDVVAIDEVGGQLVALPTESQVRLKRRSGATLLPPAHLGTPPSGALTTTPSPSSIGAPVALRAVVALTQNQSTTGPQHKRLRGLAALDAVREFGGGQRGLDVQGAAPFMTGLARVANGAEIWRVERTAEGPTPAVLADDILGILTGGGEVAGSTGT